MQIVNRPEQVRAASRAARAQGKTIGFFPTMGALHDGHLSLVDVARKRGADVLFSSIFVNPTQFGPGEDLGSYPRTLERDAALLRERGVDVLFTPSAEVMYAPDAETHVSLDRLPDHLCGLSRPVHFGGVATVCAALFNIVDPDFAVFGEKDFQQLQVLKRMVRDLHFGLEIVGAPIVRESDGLAMSSRNRYLSPDERARATCLSRALEQAAQAVRAGQTDARTLVADMIAVCEQAGGEVDYVNIVDPETLNDVEVVRTEARALLAVRIGPARLIDNRRLP